MASVGGAVAGALCVRFVVPPLFLSPPSYGGWAAPERPGYPRGKLLLLWLAASITAAVATVAAAHGLDALVNGPARASAAFALGIAPWVWAVFGAAAGLLGLGLPLYVPLGRALVRRASRRGAPASLPAPGWGLLLPSAVLAVLAILFARAQTLFLSEGIRDVPVFALRATERSYVDVRSIVERPAGRDGEGWLELRFADGSSLDLGTDSTRFWAAGRTVGYPELRDGVVALLSREARLSPTPRPTPVPGGDPIAQAAIGTFLVVSFGAWSFASARRRRLLRRLPRSWGEIARRGGHRLQSNDGLPSLDGTFRSWRFCAAVHVDRSRGADAGGRRIGSGLGDRYVECRLDLPEGLLPRGFATRARRSWETLLAAPGAVDTGDAEYDARVETFCDEPASLPAFLGAERRRCLRTLVSGRAAVFDGSIWLMTHDLPATVEELERVLAPLADAADGLGVRT